MQGEEPEENRYWLVSSQLRKARCMEAQEFLDKLTTLWIIKQKTSKSVVMPNFSGDMLFRERGEKFPCCTTLLRSKTCLNTEKYHGSEDTPGHKLNVQKGPENDCTML